MRQKHMRNKNKSTRSKRPALFFGGGRAQQESQLCKAPKDLPYWPPFEPGMLFGGLTVRA